MAQRRAGKPPAKGKANNAPQVKPAARPQSDGPDALNALLALSVPVLEAHECPIGMAAMDDPVVTSDGHSYDRVNIENWFNVKGKRTSPNTNMELPDLRLVPNMALRKAIEEYGELQAMLEVMLRNAKGALESSQAPQAMEDIRTAFEGEMQKLRVEHAKAMKAKQADVVALQKKKDQAEKSLNRLTEELTEARAELQRKEGAWRSERSLAVRKREEGEEALRREIAGLQEELDRRQQDFLDSEAAHEEAFRKLAAREEEDRVLLERTKQEQEYTLQVVKALQLMEAENSRMVIAAVKMEDSLQVVTKELSALKAEALTREQAWTEEKESALVRHKEREEALRRTIVKLKAEVEQQKASANPIKERLMGQVNSLQAELRQITTLLEKAEQAKKNAIVETTSLRTKRAELIKLVAGKEDLERQVQSLMQEVAALQAVEAERVGLERQLHQLRQERQRAEREAQQKLAVLEGKVNDGQLLVQTQRAVHQQMLTALQLEKEAVQARLRELEGGRLRQLEDGADADKEERRHEHEAACRRYQDEIAALRRREEELTDRNSQFERMLREQKARHRSEVAQIRADSDARHAQVEATATRNETKLRTVLERERNRVKSLLAKHSETGLPEDPQADVDREEEEQQPRQQAEVDEEAHELALRDWTPKRQLELRARSQSDAQCREQEAQHTAIVTRLEAEHAERLIAQKLQLDEENKASENVWTRRNAELTIELERVQQAFKEAEDRAKEATQSAAAAAESRIKEADRRAETYCARLEELKAEYLSAVQAHQAKNVQFDEYAGRLIAQKRQLVEERKAAEEMWTRRNVELTIELERVQQAFKEAEDRAKEAAQSAAAAAESRIKEVDRRAEAYRARHGILKAEYLSAVQAHQAEKIQYVSQLETARGHLQSDAHRGTAEDAAARAINLVQQVAPAPFNTPAPLLGTAPTAAPSVQITLMPSDAMIVDALLGLDRTTMVLNADSPLLMAVGLADDGAGVDTCAVIVRLFRLREKDETIVVPVLHVMHRLLLSTAADTIIEHLGAAGACEALPETMQYHCDREAIVLALEVTAELASRDQNRQRFGEANGCGMCAEALRLALQGGDRDMAYHACLSMQNLAYESEGNQMRLADCGACELSICCLNSFASEYEVQLVVTQLIYLFTAASIPSFTANGRCKVALEANLQKWADKTELVRYTEHVLKLI